MSADNKLLFALAGQQNAGKSTLFNGLTGLQQHIANYPGVTVDKKSGFYAYGDKRVEVVDLPGTYSLTSFSLEERVSREFLLNNKPDLIVNVVDASNLNRSLYLTFQLMELGYPMLLVLNMMDMAEMHGLEIDQAVLEEKLGIPVISTVGSKGKGLEELRDKIHQLDLTKPQHPHKLDYGKLELSIRKIIQKLEGLSGLEDYQPRWLALKLLEEDSEVIKLLTRVTSKDTATEILALARDEAAHFETDYDTSVADQIMSSRDQRAREICRSGVHSKTPGKVSYTERIDRFLLNRWLAPVFLVFTIWAIYQLSIVQGYELTKVTWPILAGFRNIVNGFLPDAGFLFDSQFRSISLWMVDSANTLLNYVPIFLILFALIAILEDSGYMARIAFILDRILHRFGLHGQSTLPLILAGVFAGGCAVPGVMATKGIPDHRARMATILTVPFMNCLAKVPLYTLLVNIYFPTQKGIILFYISTITVIVALLVSKLLSVSVLRGMETAPFVMELPHYHVPGVKSVVRRSLERTWIYIKKVGTIVVAVATVVYVLLQYPGLTAEQEKVYQQRAEKSIQAFYKDMKGNPYYDIVSDQDKLVKLINIYSSYKAERLNTSNPKALDARYEKKYPEFFPFLRTGKLEKENRAAINALRKLDRKRKTYRREMKEIKIENSILGRVGRGLEYVTKYADFDWKINVALLSSFAARESSVATLGVLFGQSDDENQTLEQRMGSEQEESGHGSLSAVALILFFALYPPCLATTIMIRVQTGSYKWMIFSMVFPTFLGLVVASCAYTFGSYFNWSGMMAFTIIYFTALIMLLVVGLYKNPFGAHLKTPPYAAEGASP